MIRDNDRRPSVQAAAIGSGIVVGDDDARQALARHLDLAPARLQAIGKSLQFVDV